MSTVLDALRKAQEGGARGAGAGPGDGLPPEPPRRRGSRLLWVFLGILALVLAFAGGLELSGGDRASPEEDPNLAASSDPEEMAALEIASPGESSPDEPTDQPDGVARVGGSAGSTGTAATGADALVARADSPPVGGTVAAAETDRALIRKQAADARARARDSMNERKRQMLDRVAARREERQTRRADRDSSRAEAMEMREAIRAAPTPEEREALLKEFRERRAVARAEQRADYEERRLARARQKPASESQGGEKRGRYDGWRSSSARRDSAGSAAAGSATGRPGALQGEEGRAPSPPVGAVQAQAPVRQAVAAVVDASAPSSGVAGQAGGPAAPRSVVEVAAADDAVRRAPSGAPPVRINILQWSSDPGRRFAYVSLEGQPAMTQVREGESFEGLTVQRILPETVEFAHQGSTFVLRAN